MTPEKPTEEMSLEKFGKLLDAGIEATCKNPGVTISLAGGVTNAFILTNKEGYLELMPVPTIAILAVSTGIIALGIHLQTSGKKIDTDEINLPFARVGKVLDERISDFMENPLHNTLKLALLLETISFPFLVKHLPEINELLSSVTGLENNSLGLLTYITILISTLLLKNKTKKE